MTEYSPCPEFAAVVASTVWPRSEEADAALEIYLQRGLNWNHFLAIVRTHRVGGLVHASISSLSVGAVPQSVFAKLRTAATQIVQSSLRTAAEAHRLVQTLSRMQIPAAVLKGPPLAILLYGNLTRHSKDLDLLIAPENVAIADKLLQQNGYQRQVPPLSWDAHEVKVFQIYRSHFEYVNETGINVELHWRTAENEHFGPQRIDPGNWQTVSMGAGMMVPTLGMLDLAEYLCTHGASHAWSRLKWLADVAAIIRRHPELAGELIKQSCAHGTSRAVGQALMLCESWYGLPVFETCDRGAAVRLLTGIASHAMTANCGSGEVEENRPLNAVVHLSQFLLSAKKAYLATELRNEVLMPPAWPHKDAGGLRRLLHRVYRLNVSRSREP